MTMVEVETGMAHLANENGASSIKEPKMHKLNDTWVLYAHLPHDSDWTIASYKTIVEASYAEQVIAITDCLHDDLVTECMLFWMRKGIQPMWEDPQNRGGGCFSYKIPNKDVYNVWKKISFMLCGEILANDTAIMNTINGITISPKKNFCILKIWFNSCKHQDPTIINYPGGNVIGPQGCLFKRHSPEY